MSIIGTIALGAVSTFVPGAGVAIAIYRYGKDVVFAALKRAASYLFLHPMTAVAIAAVLAGLFYWHRDSGDRAATGRAVAAFQTERQAFAQEKHAFETEKVSLVGALVHINANNRTIAAQATDLDRAKHDDAANRAHNAKLAQSTDAEIAAVKASAADPHRVPCTLPNEAKKALEGL